MLDRLTSRLTYMTETNRNERCPPLINFQKQIIQGLRPSTSVITKRVTLAAERCESATDDQQTVFTLRPRGIRFESSVPIPFPPVIVTVTFKNFRFSHSGSIAWYCHVALVTQSSSSSDFNEFQSQKRSFYRYNTHHKPTRNKRSTD